MPIVKTALHLAPSVGGKKKTQSEDFKKKIKKLVYTGYHYTSGFRKPQSACCVVGHTGNFGGVCKQMIKALVISMVIRLFMCVIASYNALILYGL